VHEKVSAEEAARIPVPARSQSPGKKGKSKGKGKDGGKGKTKSKDASKVKGKDGKSGGKGTGIKWCSAFLTAAGCSYGDNCKFPHLTEDAVEAIKKSQANAAQKGGGKGS
jgi:hypothetical protein